MNTFPAALALSGLLLAACTSVLAEPAPEPALWSLAKQCAPTHRFSTLFTAQDVRDQLSHQDDLARAIAWCKETGVTKVYLEEFRDGYQAERAALQGAKAAFTAAGLQVSGCVTTTHIGKSSTGWRNVASCYTDQATQQKVQDIFEFAAGLFDEIMIDDFWFTDCACPDCDAARKAKTARVGEHAYPVAGDTWADYRCELMTRVSMDRVLAPAKRVNPRVQLIIKYPQWYDNFHERGYDVARETAAFDRIWVGTETRDYEDRRWGGTPQYEGYFVMRWLGGIGGAKCGGGWFDPFGTTGRTYLEQARQTVLGAASESMLFCYGSLLRDTGPKNIEILRANEPELFAVAKAVRSRPVVGVAAYKPANSPSGKEARVFDFVGMMGLPLVPAHQFPTNASAAFFSVHALKDPGLPAALEAFIHAGKPVLLTDGLARALNNRVQLDRPNVQLLRVNEDPKSLLKLEQEELDDIRERLLYPLGFSFHSPNRVGLYLFKDGSWVMENFNDSEARVTLNGKSLTIPARDWRSEWK